MNDEEEVLTVEEPQEEQQQQQDRIYRSNKKESIGDRIDKAGETVTGFGKTVENFGHAEEKLGGMLKGKEKADKAVNQGVDAASSAVQTGASAAEKAAAAKKAVAQGAGKTAEGVDKAAGAVKEAAVASTKADDAAAKAGTKLAEAGAATAETGVGAAGAVAGTAVAAGAEAKKALDTAVAAGAAGTQAGAKTVKAGSDLAAAEAGAEGALAKGAEKTAGGVNKANKLAKKGNEASSALADKLEHRGKRHIQLGKKIQEVGGQIDSEGLVDSFSSTAGKAGKIFGTLLKGIIKVLDPKTFVAVNTLLVIVISILLTYVLSPMFFIDGVKDFVSDPDRIEKASNYLSSLGFQDSEKAFYEELEYLNAHYDNQLDYSYIMATLYYVDVYYGEKNLFNNGDISTMCGGTTGKPCNSLQIGFSLAKQYLKEASSTVGEDGLTYSANKIYRLRQLAKSQFLGDKTIESLPLDEYIAFCSEKMDAEQKQFLKILPYVLTYMIADVLGVGPAYDKFVSTFRNYKVASDVIKVLEGTESWVSVTEYFKNGKYLTQKEQFVEALGTFIEAYFSCFTNIESISIDKDKLYIYLLPTLRNLVSLLKSFAGSDEFTDEEMSAINKEIGSENTENNESNGLASCIIVNYYEYSFNKDEYENYLLDYYIRYMPEFSSLIKDENGKVSEDRIYGIAYEIKLVKELYDELYNKQQSAEEENVCVGNMNLDLIDQLNLPIDLEVGKKITFKNTNNFGLYKGEIHNGVDLEDISTGTKAGDKVYSVYTGTVVESTYDNTFSDKSVKGGWVAIRYIVRYADSSMGSSKLAERYGIRTSDIIVYYGGLRTSDFKLKKGQAVKKGEVIGHVGSSSESEIGVKSSLHFGVYDEWSQRFLSPVNMFITCRSSVTKMCGTNNEQKIWTFLLSNGYTKEAAAGIMGVWKRESGLIPYIVQNRSKSKSKSYTLKVDTGLISRKKFAEEGPGGGGYGLAQWTTPASRKYGLYDYAREKGTSIGDLKTQLEYFDKEITDKYKETKTKLNEAKTVEEATKIFLRDYEGGGSSSLELRTEYANDIYNKYKNFSCK